MVIVKYLNVNNVANYIRIMANYKNISDLIQGKNRLIVNLEVVLLKLFIQVIFINTKDSCMEVFIRENILNIKAMPI